MTVAVVILNYNGRTLMQKYLPSVIAGTPDAEIIVADNGSTDDSVTWLCSTYPAIHLITLDRNYGFAEGYNRALQHVDADLYVLLNSDVETPAGWLAPLTRYMDRHPRCAACQPKILSAADHTRFEYAGAAGGFIDLYGYPFCRGRVMDNIEPDRQQYDTVAEIFWATGACLAIRSEVYWEVGGLDGRFFAHQEEIDLCWRLKARRHSITCIPQSAVYHVGGGSLGYESPLKTKLNFRNNALLLYKNLDAGTYRYVAPLRFMLDMVAALRILLQGKPANARAVIRAHREFRRMKPDFAADRQDNLRLTQCTRPQGLLPGLLLWHVYARGRKRYSLLEKWMSLPERPS